MEQVLELARDFKTITFWAMVLLPIVSAMSLAQIYKLHMMHTKKKKPPNYQCAIVATIFCAGLLTLVHGLMGSGGWKYAAGVGVMLGPAAPFLWWMAGILAPEKISRAMRGQRERRNGNRTPGVWTEEQRERMRNDTLYGDTSNWSQDQIRQAMERERFDDAKDRTPD